MSPDPRHGAIPGGPAIQEAAWFLRVALDAGGRPAKDVIREAAALGIPTTTLHRARKVLGIEDTKHGNQHVEPGTAISWWERPAEWERLQPNPTPLEDSTARDRDASPDAPRNLPNTRGPESGSPSRMQPNPTLSEDSTVGAPQSAPLDSWNLPESLGKLSFLRLRVFQDRPNYRKGGTTSAKKPSEVLLGAAEVRQLRDALDALLAEPGEMAEPGDPVPVVSLFRETSTPFGYLRIETTREPPR